MPGLIHEKPDGGSEGLRSRSRAYASRAYLVLSLLAASLAAAMIPLGLMADGPGSDSATGAAAKVNSAPYFIIPGNDAAPAPAGEPAAGTSSIRASELVIESVSVRPAGSHEAGPSIASADSTAFGIAVLEVERGGIMGTGTSPMMAGLLAALAGALGLALVFAWMMRRRAVAAWSPTTQTDR